MRVTTKYNKAVVNYRPMKEVPVRCGLCHYYISGYADEPDHHNDDDNGCHLISGQIVADYRCDLFEPCIPATLDDDSSTAWSPPRQSTIAPLDMPSLYPSPARPV